MSGRRPNETRLGYPSSFIFMGADLLPVMVQNPGMMAQAGQKKYRCIWREPQEGNDRRRIRGINFRERSNVITLIKRSHTWSHRRKRGWHQSDAGTRTAGGSRKNRT